MLIFDLGIECFYGGFLGWREGGVELGGMIK